VDYTLNNGDDVTKDFKINDEIFQDFLKKATELEIEYTETDVDSARAFIEISLESDIIAKKLSPTEAYIRNLELDKQYNEAVKILEEHPSLDALFDYALTQKKEEVKDGE
jgi:hypothetical protein